MSAESDAKIAKFMARITAAADVALTEAGKVLADTIVKSLGRDHGGLRSKADGPPNSQTGILSRSIGYSKAENLRSVVGCGVFYGKVLEFGKEIHAKGKAMLVPLSRLAVRAYLETSSGRSALIWYSLKVGHKNVVKIKRPGHTLIGHKVGGKAARIEFDFMLTSKVVIKPRPFMRPSLAKAKASKSMSNAFADTMRREMGVK